MDGSRVSRLTRGCAGRTLLAPLLVFLLAKSVREALRVRRVGAARGAAGTRLGISVCVARRVGAGGCNRAGITTRVTVLIMLLTIVRGI